MGNDRWQRVGMVYAAAVCVAYAVVILLHPQPPALGDFAEWVYQGVLLSRRWHGIHDSAYVFKHYPVPNSLLTLLLGLLTTVLPWKLAAKLFLLGYLAAVWLATRSLSLAAASAPVVWFAVPTLFFLAIDFWYGLFAFQLGLAVLLCFVAALLRGAGSRWLSVLLLLLFFTHMVVFAFACLLLVCRAAVRSRPRGLWVLAPSLTLLAWYTAARFRTGDPDADALVPHAALSTGMFLAYKVNSILKSFGLVNPANEQHHSLVPYLLGPFALPLALSLAVATAAAWLVLAAGALRKAAPWRKRNDAASLALAFALSLAAYLALPRDMLGISDPGTRVLQIVLVITPFFFIARGWRSWSLAVPSVALGIFAFVLFARTAFVVPPADVRSVPLPIAAGRVGMVPYDYAVDAYVLLDHQRFENPIFQTGLIAQRQTATPAPR